MAYFKDSRSKCKLAPSLKHSTNSCNNNKIQYKFLRNFDNHMNYNLGSIKQIIFATVKNVFDWCTKKNAKRAKNGCNDHISKQKIPTCVQVNAMH